MVPTKVSISCFPHLIASYCITLHCITSHRIASHHTTSQKEADISNFFEIYNLKNLVKKPTCFKSDRPRSIDLILTNRASSFQCTDSIETGLSDFHCMIITVLKGGFLKKGPKLINYRDYRNFNINNFRIDVHIELQNMSLRIK